MWTTCALGSVFFCVSGCLDNISLREDYIDHPTTKQHVSCRFNTLGYLFLIKPRSFSFLTFMHLHFICILCVGVGVSLDLSVHVKLNLLQGAIAASFCCGLVQCNVLQSTTPTAHTTAFV